MCTERDISVIRHSETIHPDIHLNKSGLYLGKCGIIAFAK